MYFRLMLAFLCAVGLFQKSAMAEKANYRWHSSISMGIEEALVRNASKGGFIIDRPSGQTGSSPSFFIHQEIDQKIKIGEKVEVSFVIDGKQHSFLTNGLRFQARSKAEIGDMLKLGDDFMNSKNKNFYIYWSKYDRKETFSLKNAREALTGSDHNILDECVNPR